MNRTAIFLASLMFLTTLPLHAGAPRSRRHGVSTTNAVDEFNSRSQSSEFSETVSRPRRGKSIAQIETAYSVKVKQFNPPDVTQWTPAPAKSVQVAALPSPVSYPVLDNMPAQKIESLPDAKEVVEFGFPSSGSIPMEMGSSDFVLAKEKTLTPTLEDGVNDEAVFGPGAEEVTIKDIRGRRIFHARRNGVSALRWDCRGPAGKVVEEGVYFVLLLNQEGIEFRQSFTVLR